MRASPSGLRCGLGAELRSRFVDLALGNLAREYPAKLDQVLGGPGDLRTPRARHPLFHGSFDWHSSVHAHWMLARLARSRPSAESRTSIRQHFARRFDARAVATELAVLAEPGASTFERPYGWAWLLALADELAAWSDPEGRRCRGLIEPLAARIRARFTGFLPRADYAVRAGTHVNSAFALVFALHHARRIGDRDLESLCLERSRHWFGTDRNAPVHWEPSGFDFLSPALAEAELMRHVFPPAEFANWLTALVPTFGRDASFPLAVPVRVADRSDPHIVHLDGLNLSRAWCWRGIAASLPATDPRRELAGASAARHLAAGLDAVATGDYSGDHWLATFAVLATSA